MNTFIRCFRWLFVVLPFVLAHPSLSGQDESLPEPLQVLQAVDSIRAPGDSFHFDLDVLRTDGEETREFSFNVRVKDQQKSLVTYTKPVSSKGKRILMVGENLWIYVPRTRIPIRISAQQTATSSVSNADVARVIFSLDYQADKLEKTQVDGEAQYHLKLSAKTKAAAYQRVELWVDAHDFRPRKADLFTQTGRQLKTILYKDYQTVLGVERPMLLEIYDALKENQKVSMRYKNMQLADTPDRYFQKNFLPRLPK